MKAQVLRTFVLLIDHDDERDDKERDKYSGDNNI